jgi:hypothetical protein
MAANPSQSERFSLFLVTVIVGVALGILQTAVWLFTGPFASNTPYTASPQTFFLLVAPLIWVITFFVQGIWAGKRTGKVGQSTLLGIFTGVFGGITASVGNILVATLNLGGSYSSSQAMLASYLIIYILMLTIGGGAGFSALGGLIGQYISPLRPQPSPPPMQTMVPPYGPPASAYYMPPQQPQQPQQSRPPVAPQE